MEIVTLWLQSKEYIVAQASSPYSGQILFFLGTILYKNPATEKPDP